jgi:cell division protein FtsB
MPQKRVKGRPMSLKELVLIGLLSAALVWLLYLNFSIYPKEEIARQAAKNTQRQLASLKARENSLQSNISELSTPRGQEATMRQTFGVARPGENVIIVVPAKTASTTPPVTFWQKYFGWAAFWQKKSP